MKDRIRQLMEDQHLTQQNFAQMIGISTATLSNIFNGKTNPSLSIVDGIHKSFPQVNVYWVLYGTPPMYQNQASQGGSEEGVADMYQDITDACPGGDDGDGVRVYVKIPGNDWPRSRESTSCCYVLTLFIFPRCPMDKWY